MIKRIIKKCFKRYFYLQLPYGLLVVNFILQRIFRINSQNPFMIHFTSRIIGGRNIIFPINDPKILISFATSGGCYFNIFPGTNLKIGKGTIWACNVSILTGNHGLIDRSAYVYKNIVIGENCWLGAGVTLLPGVELGSNVTVGANSVVTKSFGSNVVIGGCPAKIIKQIQE